MKEVINYIVNFWDYLRNIIDILVIAFMFYWAYSYLAKTRAVQLFKGFFVVFVVAIVANRFQLESLNWILTNLANVLPIVVIIIFQPEIRRLITHFGQRNWGGGANSEDSLQLDELVSAIAAMSEEKIGSLIVIERNSGLRNYAESGVMVNSGISEELMRTIFFPNTALHDGAIIIREGKILAAACYLPLSDSKQLKKHHGARHRAALGIAEETDALVIVTSEETGGTSIMVNQKIYGKVKLSDLKNMLLYFLNPKTAYEEKYSIK